MSNIGRALRRLYLGRSAPKIKDDGSPNAYAQVTRQMVEDIRDDVADMRSIQKWEFALIAGTVIAEILRFVFNH